MAKYKPYDYSQSLLIPVSLQEQLMPGTLEFAIHTLVEGRMDMSVFDSKYQNAYSARSRTGFRLIANSVPIHPEQRSDSSRTAFRLIANTIPEHPEQEISRY